MRILLCILSIFIFLCIGNGQTKCNNIVDKSVRIHVGSSNIPSGQHAIILENNLSGTLDSDEPDNVEYISILPENYYLVQKSVIKRTCYGSFTIKINIYCELLLDLPPPEFSI